MESKMQIFSTSNFRKLLWRTPVTWVLIVLMWALVIVTYAAPGLDGITQTIGLTGRTFGTVVALTLMALAFVLSSEYRLGSLRTLAVGIVTQLISVPLAYVAAHGIEELGLNRWGDDLLSSTDLSPIGFIVGTAGFASAWMPRPWQRRVRVSILALTLTMALYGGTLSDVLGVTASVLSIAAGIAWSVFAPRTNAQRPTAFHRASVPERRVLTALILGMVAIGPAFVALDPLAEGPFSPVTRLMWSFNSAAYHATELCQAGPASQGCLAALDVARVQGVGPAIASFMPLIIQLVLCFGLIRGRRLAWWLSALTQLLVIAVLLAQLWDLSQEGLVLYGVNLAAVVLPWTTCLVVLIWNRRVFHIHESARALGQAAGKIAAAFVITAAFWGVGALLFKDGFVETATAGSILAELPLRYVPPVVATLLPLKLAPTTWLTWTLYEWVGTLFWMYTSWVVYRMFATPANREAAEARERARAILEQGSGDHLSSMTLWKGNRYFFNDNNYVAYRVYNGIALSLGEPVGSDPQVTASAFEDFAREQGWRPAWYSVRESFNRPGFRRLEVAEEAVLDTSNTEFKGKKFQSIRTARNKAGKEGVTTLWTEWKDLDLATRNKIAELSEEWVSDKALPEMGFTLGGVTELREEGTKLLLALGEDGTLHGVTSWLPVRENGSVVGYTLDVMRRADHGFKGTIELLISEAMIIAAGEGCAWISLSGAPLSGTPEEPGLLDALLTRLGEEMEPLYGFRSLAASKRKFQPEEHKWYLFYNDELALPAIGLAVVHAYVPDMSAADAARAVKTWLAERKQAKAERGATEHSKADPR